MPYRVQSHQVLVSPKRLANGLLVLLLTFALLTVNTSTPARAAALTHRVVPGGITSGGCGATWATACDLQNAISLAISGDSLWVKEGTYTPGSPRSNTFHLMEGVKIYGGFAGTETLLQNRDPAAHVTILSGEIGAATVDDNSQHVVTAAGVTSASVLDGFTITRGNADMASGAAYGGGMWIDGGSPTINNLVFLDNTASGGGALYISSPSTAELANVTFSYNTAVSTGVSSGGALLAGGAPTLKDVTFDHNSADQGGAARLLGNLQLTNVTFEHNTADYGGAVDINSSSSPKFTDATFRANASTHSGGAIYNSSAAGAILAGATFSANSAGSSGTGSSGGGMFNNGGAATLANVTFAGNRADWSGGGMGSASGSIVTLRNATFSGNSAPNYGALQNYHNTLVIEDSIFWGDGLEIDIQYSSLVLTDSIVQGGCPAGPSTTCTNVLTSNPVLSPLADYGGPTWTMAVAVGSPAVDAGGTNAACITPDQRGVTRPTGLGCDMGAYEYGQHVISGNAGVGGAVLSYTDVTPKTATANANGDYSFLVSYDWSGIVIPSKTGYSFAPDHRDYSNVLTHQTTQDYTVTDLWNPWYGSVSITSDRPVVAVGRPHVGTEVASYNGFAAGSLTAYLPMLFKDAFGGSYDSAFYVQNVDADHPAHISLDYYDTSGAHSCGPVVDTVEPLSSHGYWLPGESCLPDGWVGSVVVTSSDWNIVAVARPHVGSEVMTYNGFAEGALMSYLPMLFKNGFDGTYDSAFYVQNLDGVAGAGISIHYYDTAGNLTCPPIADTIPPLASHGYWLPAETCLPVGWVGSAVVVSALKPVVAVARPHIGSQVTTYNGFTAGSTGAYLPMLFKNAWGSYNAAFYLQNLDSSEATVSIDFYDSDGNPTCSRMADTIAAKATRGYWLPSETCLPTSWVGGAVVTTGNSIVAVGRPHIGAQITTYNGFSAGSAGMSLPMLFKQMWGSYDSAFYIQNVDDTYAALVSMKYYDVNGHLACEWNESIPALSTLGYWVPSAACAP